MENSSEPGDTPGILPSLALNGFSLRVPSASTALHQLQPSVPRIPIPPKRSGKLVRPSTASSAEERLSLLPSAPNGAVVEVIAQDSSQLAVQEAVTPGAQDQSKKDPSGKGSHPTLGA